MRISVQLKGHVAHELFTRSKVSLSNHSVEQRLIPSNSQERRRTGTIAPRPTVTLSRQAAQGRRRLAEVDVGEHG